MKKTAFTILVQVVIAELLVTSQLAHASEFIPLGFFPDANYSLAHAVSDDGTVVAGYAGPSDDRELRLLEDAVRKWMVADVEVGSFRSSGYDSSIIAAIAARAIDRPLKTFSVGLEGSPDILAAANVARHIGSEHYQMTFTVDDIARAAPHVIYHLESADVDLVRNAIPTHFATTLARQHVKAVLAMGLSSLPNRSVP